MPKDIRYLSKRRIHQLITSQTANAFKCENSNHNRDNNIIETYIVGSVSNNVEDENEIDDTIISSFNISDNSNVNLNTHIIDKEIVHNDLNAHNVYINVNPDIHEKLSIQRRDLVGDLRSWVIQHNISQTALNKLLEILRTHDQFKLPRDARTLMQTPKRATHIINNVNNGSYIHFDIKNGIKRLLTKYFDTCPNKIEIQINCDGISTSKSTNSQFWPILILLFVPIYTNPIVVGMHYGLSKPTDANIYLREFVNEMIDIKRNGIDFNNTNCKIAIQAIICDAPARAFITYTKGHAGYFGCSKCIQEGEYKNCVVFPECNSNLRTDKSFRKKEQIEHHTGTSILEKLQIDMVSQIALDYMHLVCLGIMKRLLTLWLKGPKNIRLRANQQEIISKMLLKARSSIPYEFARLPRSLEDYGRWKATEFRLFLLYLGPVFLKNVLSNEYYTHFLTFSVGIRILCHSELCLSMNHYAHNLLLYFVSNFSELYGVENMSYNVHNLIHLSNEVKRFGCLDKFSCFPFENYLRILRKKIKNSPKPLEQLVNRLKEEDTIPIKKILKKSYPIIYYKNLFQVSKIEYEEFIISPKEPNNCVMSNNRIILINKLILENGNVYLCGHKITDTQSFFLEPCNSLNLNIIVIDNFSTSETITISAKEVQSKCLKLSISDSDKSVVIPLIHHR